MQEATCPANEADISEITDQMEPGQGLEEAFDSPLPWAADLLWKEDIKGARGTKRDNSHSPLSHGAGSNLHAPSTHPTRPHLGYQYHCPSVAQAGNLEVVCASPLSSPQVPSVSKCYQFHQVSIRPSLRQFIPPSTSLWTPPSLQPSVCLSLHPPIHPSFHSSIRLSLCPSFYPSIHPSLPYSILLSLHSYVSTHSHHSRQSLIFSHLGNLSSLPIVPCVQFIPNSYTHVLKPLI